MLLFPFFGPVSACLFSLFYYPWLFPEQRLVIESNFVLEWCLLGVKWSLSYSQIGFFLRFNSNLLTHFPNFFIWENPPVMLGSQVPLVNKAVNPNLLPLAQPHSQCLSSHCPPGGSQERLWLGLLTCHFNNWKHFLSGNWWCWALSN